MRRIIWSLLALILSASPCFAQYVFTTVDYPGASATRFVGVNDHFDIVGNYQMPGALRHAMLYSKGRFVPLDPDGVLGSTASGATQINNRGDIVGWYQAGAARHGFLLRDGILTTIDYPGATNNQVNGISDTGVVIGQFVGADRRYHGYILEDGTFTQLDYPGALDTLPFYITARGDIAGEWDENQAQIGHGFLLTRDGEWITFDAPDAAANSTMAIGISDDRQILGLFAQPDGRRRGFVLDGRNIDAAQYTEFDLPGDSATPETINNTGAFVGIAVSGGIAHGFIATPDPRR